MAGGSAFPEPDVDDMDTEEPATPVSNGGPALRIRVPEDVPEKPHADEAYLATGHAERQLGWFRQLGRLAGSVAEKVKPTWASRKPPIDKDFISFELADVMEQGLARELTTSFITPPPKHAPSQHLRVHRSQDRAEHVLASEEGLPLLTARGQRDSGRVDFYVPLGGDPPVHMGPAFTLACHNDGDSEEQRWTLTSDRCEGCEYLPQARACCGGCRREVAHIRHRRERIGQGQVMCMEVDVPALRADGTPSVWCSRAGGEWSKVALESRRPTWSQRIKSLTLDFYGRCTKASAKNFQLQLAGTQSVPRHRKQESEMLFGKIDEDEFVLDYRHPLGMAQAFAVALSTKDWQ